jgi:hypothetical protein
VGRGELKMRKSLAVGVFLSLFGTAPLAKAQEEPSKIELYGGYDYVRYNANPRISGVPPFESYSANGVTGQVGYNAMDWLGVVADFSGYAVVRQGFATTHQISYLFGPRISLRRGKFTPFT